MTAFPTTGRPDLTAEPARDTTAEIAALDDFLRGVERRALRMAELSTGNRDDALEIVQDAMLAFVRRYATRAAAEWAPLFHRVIENRIVDFHRRDTVRRKLRAWFGSAGPADDDAEDAMARIPDTREPMPWQRVADGETARALDDALRALPVRQRQAFLWRVWEGLDVADTAAAMGCGEGSVKTHLSRAMHALRDRLEAWR
jgi:RNA polymerase sigma-70 factor, ECF subfamily